MKNQVDTLTAQVLELTGQLAAAQLRIKRLEAQLASPPPLPAPIGASY